MDLSIPLAGLQAQSAAFDTAARGIVRSSGNSISVADGLDLSGSAIAMLQAKVGFEADVRTADVEQEMDKSTLSMLG